MPTRLTGSPAWRPPTLGDFVLLAVLHGRVRDLRRLLVCAGLATALLAPHESAAQTRAGTVARAVSVQGTVEARRVGESQWQPVKLNDTYAPGDTIRVQANSRAELAILDQSVLRLNAGTTLTVEAVKDERTGVVELLRGATHFLSRGPRSLDVRTPFTTAGVRGTEFLAVVGDDSTLLTVFEGEVLASNQAGSLALRGGQSAVAEQGKAPVLRTVARPRDAVHWTLYYPPVVYFGPDEFAAESDWRGAARASLEAYTTGDLQRAFGSIQGVPPDVGDARFFAHRASLLLAVGQVDAAGADIERALKLRANDPNALALQSIVATVQGEKDRALEIAQRAVQAAPDSGAARIALSYAQQAQFDLEGARASLEETVKREPQNALAWARLAELHASFGELGKALDAAQKAVALQPNLARTQTVLGYAYLMQVKTRQAREAFEKAIGLDQADPLPRLGLGLARIRDGGLHEGSRDIEAAAGLDPSNALVRSYLGKAYYEEKRGPLDEREYSVAKELDPNDPTPWFYDAITKQTTNRPVEALRSLQKAIELNDNRAVYRSRLLLDADEAARGASIARIYSDLGFQQRALVEGWKSVNTDPTNFAAHRFLADSYAALPRHEVARVSELLQSQLLQPLNSTPIQPRLAESNLFLISAGGPGALSFNEFNPLFNRDRVTFQLTGLVGEHDTYAGEGVVAGLYGRTALSVGYTHFETDGFRTNFDQTDDLVNVFIQHDVSYRTSVQGEFRYRKTENGDLQLNFFPEDILANFRQSAETYTGRAGLRHSFTPASILLASVMYQYRDDRAHDENEPAIPFVTSLDSAAEGQEGVGGELQHLFRSTYVNLVSGLGYFRIMGDQETVTELDLPDGPFTFADALSLDANHFNVYAYSYVNFPQTVTWTLGASFDMFDPDARRAWTPTSSTRRSG